MKRVSVFLGLLGALLTGLLAASCASGPEPAAVPVRHAPDWITSLPENTASDVYFVGIGSDDTGDAAAAENTAVNDMLGEITRFLGVRITAEMTVETKDTIKTYEQKLTEKIKQSSKARVDDFRVVEKWIDRTDGRITVYLLGKYDRKALEREQQRLKDLFKEQQEAISGPEQEGDALAAQQKGYQAALKYIEAATAASSSDVDNAAVKVERNINKAKTEIDTLNLFALNGNLTTFVGREFSEPFRAVVVAGSTPDSPGIPGVNIKIVYKEMRKNGRMGIESLIMQSGADGDITFMRPAPKFIGSGQLTMMLDFGASLEALQDAPAQYQDLVEGLEQRINGKRIDFQYSIESRAKNISTGIVLMDVDRAGNPRKFSDTQAGVLESLTNAGFKVKPLAVNFSLQGVSDQEVIRRIREAFGSQVKRVVFGVASITDFNENGGNYIVTVSGTVKAADLSTGEILYTGNSFKRSRGTNIQSALAAAFKELGRDFGEELSAKLP